MANKRVRFLFSDVPLVPEAISSHYRTVRKSIVAHFQNPNADPELIGLTPDKIELLKDSTLEELEKEAVLALITSLEAVFRTDFIIRVEAKKRDTLSKHFKSIIKETEKKSGIRLPYFRYGIKEVIIDGWKEYRPNYKTAFDSLGQIFEFRNWMAHGRYWIFKDSVSKYTYSYVETVTMSLKTAIGNDLLHLPT